mgnify:FL=1
MVIDEKKEYDDDDMKVIHKNGEVQRVSKKIPAAEANGESIGIIKYSNKGPKIFVDMLDTMVRDLQNRNLFYLQAIQNIIDKGFKVHYSMCKESDWAELDFHPDLKLIRTYLSRNKVLDQLIKKIE